MWYTGQVEFNYKKSLGQNFIYDSNYLRVLVAKLGVSKQDQIVEVGAGAGTLTAVLAETDAQILSIEIDQRLQPILTKRLQNYRNVNLVCGDALQQDYQQLPPFRLIANVPYYITTPLLIKFLSLPNCRNINILVADEVAKRITARVGTPEYGALSILCQLQADCDIVQFVPRTMFTPQPKIDSAFVRLTKKTSVLNPDLNNLLKAVFAARRKTMLNALSGALRIDKSTTAMILEQTGIALTARPEQVTPTEYWKICTLSTKYRK